ncbi:CPBP family intramembrane glutamic endopeptidase [Bosea sp. BK604]|uniref:CPBP family intramembrane glutamic endopeptidase n=1 Tax=Bosea sp. BK604 TaxID=2512180 RepID=UPI00104C562A|nr:CPBP family intramembrane glutamic endopeptidase [Bosea sp. BK604]TCR61722.1 CAAX prenyl protease-like protein [Bosea sp. BK604]
MERAVALAFGQVLLAVGFGYAGMAGAVVLWTSLAGRPLGFDAREAAFFLSVGVTTFAITWAAGDRPFRRSLALAWPQDRRIAIWFGAALAAVLAVEAAVALSGLLGSLEEMKAMSSSERSALGLANAVLLAPVVEELLFRGQLFTTLRRHLAVLPALAVTTIAFGLLHLENGLLHVVSVLPAGAFLGYARELSGGIGLPILLHACMNAAVILAGLLL